MEKCYRQCKHEFTREELDEIANALTAALIERQEVEGQLETSRTQLKAKITAIQAQVDMLSSKHHAKYEMRSTECKIVQDYEASKITVTRVDTGEVIEERPITEKELQMSLSAASEK